MNVFTKERHNYYIILYIIKTLWDVYFKNRHKKNKPIPPTRRRYLFTEETKEDINI